MCAARVSVNGVAGRSSQLRCPHRPVSKIHGVLKSAPAWIGHARHGAEKFDSPPTAPERKAVDTLSRKAGLEWGGVSCEGADRKTEWALRTRNPPQATGSVWLTWNQAQGADFKTSICSAVALIGHAADSGKLIP